MLACSTEADALTEAQSLFASRHAAVPVMRSDRDSRMIFMYRSDELRTFRWLVDHTGEVVESAAFRAPIVRSRVTV
ncbi:MAG: hypothetical protein M3Z06_04505 [Actinomycetota bacterium]|nr:hypothetical protein [Actinomycetota bacterium]